MNTRIRTLLLSLPTCFTLACGDLPDTVDAIDAIDAEADDLAAQDDQDSATILTATQHSASGTAAQIAQHPAFAQLSQRAWVRLGQVLDVKATMTSAELEATYAMLEHCRDASNPACATEVEANGFVLSRTNAEIQAATALNAAFHLDAMAATPRAELLHQAQIAYLGAGGQAPPPSLVPDSFDGDTYPCDATCKADVLDGLDVAHAGTIAWTLSSSDGDAGEAGGIIGIIIGGLIIVGTAAWECYVDPDCYLPPFEYPPDHENGCTTHNDCDDDEYCWKGPLFSENECRSLKENGESCGHDYACETGCCNFYLFKWTCAPANKCN